MVRILIAVTTLCGKEISKYSFVCALVKRRENVLKQKRIRVDVIASNRAFALKQTKYSNDLPIV